MKRNCLTCNSEMKKKPGQAYWQFDKQKFCSRSCKGKMQGFREVNQPTKSCSICLKEYKKSSSQNVKWWSKSKYCSTTCYKRRIVSEETKLKMRNHRHTQETKRRIGLASLGNKYRLGKKLTDQHKRKISIAHTGEKHWNWIEDRTQLKKDEYRNCSAHREWSRQIKNRDGWRCKISNGSCSGRVEAHHILNWKDYSELRYELNNGITLCHAHHPRKRAEEKRLSPYFQDLVSVSKK